MKNFKPILTAMSLCMALAAAAAPVRQHLHDDWLFRQARLNNWYPATVPGTVHTDLMANRIIEDPYFRLNERGVQWVDKEDWIYETHFEAGADLLARERIELVFEGLDTYADVYLNDEKILTTDNMNFTEIAAALQYSTVHQFSRQFKDKFGITPTEYAKSVR